MFNKTLTRRARELRPRHQLPRQNYRDVNLVANWPVTLLYIEGPEVPPGSQRKRDTINFSNGCVRDAEKRVPLEHQRACHGHMVHRRLIREHDELLLQASFIPEWMHCKARGLAR
mmetsp:Transcript_32330/g.105054  ORF Transcript_32330/g.105054 Transcript_32330/m.105054 type:complete len:115 (+) Transcript_32330:8469-8813(+)